MDGYQNSIWNTECHKYRKSCQNSMFAFHSLLHDFVFSEHHSDFLWFYWLLIRLFWFFNVLHFLSYCVDYLFIYLWLIWSWGERLNLLVFSLLISLIFLGKYTTHLYFLITHMQMKVLEIKSWPITFFKE